MCSKSDESGRQRKDGTETSRRESPRRPLPQKSFDGGLPLRGIIDDLGNKILSKRQPTTQSSLRIGFRTSDDQVPSKARVRMALERAKEDEEVGRPCYGDPPLGNEPAELLEGPRQLPRTGRGNVDDARQDARFHSTTIVRRRPPVRETPFVDSEDDCTDRRALESAEQIHPWPKSRRSAGETGRCREDGIVLPDTVDPHVAETEVAGQSAGRPTQPIGRRGLARRSKYRLCVVSFSTGRLMRMRSQRLDPFETVHGKSVPPEAYRRRCDTEFPSNRLVGAALFRLEDDVGSHPKTRGQVRVSNPSF